MGEHADNNEPGARQEWPHQLDVDLGDFKKSYFKPDGIGHRKNHLTFGVCTLTKRRSTDAYVTPMTWIEFLQRRYGN